MIRPFQDNALIQIDASFATPERLSLSKAIFLTLFDMGTHGGPQNVFDHCAQTRRRRKLKLGDF